jgi:hypothetical protein
MTAGSDGYFSRCVWPSPSIDAMSASLPEVTFTVHWGTLAILKFILCKYIGRSRNKKGRGKNRPNSRGIGVGRRAGGRRVWTLGQRGGNADKRTAKSDRDSENSRQDKILAPGSCKILGIHCWNQETCATAGVTYSISPQCA